jgi:hypothetical protein
VSEGQETPDQARARLAVEDPRLPEVCFSTRPLYGVPGVAVSVEDASKRPYERVFVGRVGTAQALGLAGSLLLMLELQQVEDAEAPDYQRARELRDLRRRLQELAKRHEEEQA